MFCHRKQTKAERCEKDSVFPRGKMITSFRAFEMGKNRRIFHRSCLGKRMGVEK